MPVVGGVDGVMIVMHFNHHAPPHFHAVSAEHRASIALDTLAIERGSMPRAKFQLVKNWASDRRAQLLTAWNICRAGRSPELIE